MNEISGRQKNVKEPENQGCQKDKEDKIEEVREASGLGKEEKPKGKM